MGLLACSDGIEIHRGCTSRRRQTNPRRSDRRVDVVFERKQVENTKENRREDGKNDFIDEFVDKRGG